MSAFTNFLSRLCLSALLGLATAASTAQTIEYIHTDALGSVVAVTDSNRAVIERREYEPYGHQLTPVVQNGPGYTGHVQDADTGLTYMQQRYYDPQVGRFLSVDPVTADSNSGGNFNRYWYGNNNPYKFVDPDGRVSIFGIPVFDHLATPADLRASNSDMIEAQFEHDLSQPTSTTQKVEMVAVAMSFGGAIRAASATRRSGTLTATERKELQAIADKYDTTIDVVGSRAAAEGRNINQPSLPVGKGPGTRSDIDTRIDTGHPQADDIIDEVNGVSGGAGNASRKHSTAERQTYPPFIRISPSKSKKE